MGVLLFSGRMFGMKSALLQLDLISFFSFVLILTFLLISAIMMGCGILSFPEVWGQLRCFNGGMGFDHHFGGGCAY